MQQDAQIHYHETEVKFHYSFQALYWFKAFTCVFVDWMDSLEQIGTPSFETAHRPAEADGCDPTSLCTERDASAPDT